MSLMLKQPKHALAIHEDTERYVCRFDIASQSSDAVYRISFDMAAQWWTCSCRGNLGKGGHCKHLEDLGLRGRKFGPNPQQTRAFLEHKERTDAMPKQNVFADDYRPY